MKQCGQGIIEYVLILTLIVGAIIVAASPLFRDATDFAMEATAEHAVDVIDNFLEE